MRRSRVRGFSIVEILVVVSIVGVLTALLLPSLTSAREAARTMLCAGRMRQVGVMASSYQADNSQHMVPWLSTSFDPSTAHALAPQSRWSVGLRWTGVLSMEGYNRIDELLPSTGVFATETYWESNLRKQSVNLCPSGRYFGVGNSRTWGAWSSRSWPAGVGKYTSDAVDIVDMHLYNYPPPAADKTPLNITTAYALTITSYQVSRHTTRMITKNGITGYVPKKFIGSASGSASGTPASASNTVYLMEACYDITGRELDMDSEEPYANLIASPGAQREFRIPHRGTANFLAVDGHAGVVLRKHFGGAFKSERPFVFGQLD